MFVVYSCVWLSSRECGENAHNTSPFCTVFFICSLSVFAHAPYCTNSKTRGEINPLDQRYKNTRNTIGGSPLDGNVFSTYASCARRVKNNRLTQHKCLDIIL